MDIRAEPRLAEYLAKNPGVVEPYHVIVDEEFIMSLSLEALRDFKRKIQLLFNGEIIVCITKCTVKNLNNSEISFPAYDLGCKCSQNQPSDGYECLKRMLSSASFVSSVISPKRAIFLMVGNPFMYQFIAKSVPIISKMGRKIYFESFPESPWAGEAEAVDENVLSGADKLGAAADKLGAAADKLGAAADKLGAAADKLGFLS